jgi:hypothetical protein
VTCPDRWSRAGGRRHPWPQRLRANHTRQHRRCSGRVGLVLGSWRCAKGDRPRCAIST